MAGNISDTESRPAALLRSAISPRFVTIASGATTSDAYDGRRGSAFAMYLPTMTGTTVTFTTSYLIDGSYQALYDIYNAQVSLTISSSRSYDLPTELFPWPFWKIVSGSSEGADRIIWIVAKG